MITYLNIKSIYFLHKLKLAGFAGYQRKMLGQSPYSLSGFFKQAPQKNKYFTGFSPAHLRFGAPDALSTREFFIESLMSKV